MSYVQELKEERAKLALFIANDDNAGETDIDRLVELDANIKQHQRADIKAAPVIGRGLDRITFALGRLPK